MFEYLGVKSHVCDILSNGLGLGRGEVCIFLCTQREGTYVA